MSSYTPPRPPRGLSAEARRWWRRIVTAYDMSDEGGQLLLQTALEAFDRMRRCQAGIRRDGETVLDRFEQKKPNPLLAAERDSRAQMLMALRQLNLDVTPEQGGRPSADDASDSRARSASASTPTLRRVS